jgi:NAD+ synthase (glutamine-hydrolysing)
MPDVTEENLQARVRGTLLMALSNKFGWLVLAPGNKSELSVGYSTLYGDMVGGFAPIKDVFKTRVYELARWRNRDGEVIPRRSSRRCRAPSLRPARPTTTRCHPTTCSTRSSPTTSSATSRASASSPGHDRR